MSLPSTDAKAVVRALADLTTQVRRIADARQSDFALTLDATDDAPTTGYDGPVEAQQTAPDPVRQRAYDAVYAYIRQLGEQMPTSRIDRNAIIWHAVNAALDAQPCAQHPHAPVIGGHCGGCTIYPADMRAAADEDAQRTTRRASLRNLLDRADRNHWLLPKEAAALRQHVEAETRESDQWRAGRNTMKRRGEEIERERDRIAAELETADRIRAEAQRDRDQHAAVLRDVLDQFADWPKGGILWPEGGVVARVDADTWDRWDATVAPTVERPWWETVAEVRAELEREQVASRGLAEKIQEQREFLARVRGELAEAQAAIERVRELAADAKRRYRRGRNDYEIGKHDLASTVLGALDGTEQPTTEA